LSFEVQILGSNSAAPAHGRHHTAQSVRIQNLQFLVDCGEATQLQMKKYDVKKNRLSHIFISHLHGDHFLGLMGLISTMHLNGRKHELTIFGPVGLAEIITIQLKYSNTRLNYPVNFIELKADVAEVILDNKIVSVSTIPLQHKVACNGFLFKEKPKPWRLIKEKVEQEALSVADINLLKSGKDVKHENGETKYSVSDFTYPPRKSRSYAFCSDTIYWKEIIPLVKNVDMLYHEATFLHDLIDRAQQTYHTTVKQAATIAKKAEADKLIIGHFSNRYKDLTPLLEEALASFPASYLGEEGLTFSIPE